MHHQRIVILRIFNWNGSGAEPGLFLRLPHLNRISRDFLPHPRIQRNRGYLHADRTRDRNRLVLVRHPDRAGYGAVYWRNHSDL